MNRSASIATFSNSKWHRLKTKLERISPSSVCCYRGPKQHSKPKGSFFFCPILSTVITLFGVSMLIQVLTLPSTKIDSAKLALESLFAAHLSEDPTQLGWTNVDPEANFILEYFQRNEAFTVGSNFDFWQPVSTSRHRFFVFSSFVDRYDRSSLNINSLPVSSDDDPNYFIRVIAATLLNTKEKVVCLYDLSGNASLPSRTFREGWLRPIREHWNLKYSAFYVYCPLPQEFYSTDSSLSRVKLSIMAFFRNELNQALSLMRHNAQLLQSIVPSNRLPIHTFAQQGPPQKDNLAVCVKPLHYHYKKSIQLIEFIELNRLLGVEHFYFYNHTINIEVDQILRHLAAESQPLVSILPWLLPIKSQQEIRTEGIFAALNDCLYRSRKDGFEYVAFIDLDEIIIPQHYDNLLRLIADMKKAYPNKVGAFSFQNAFFYLSYSDDPVDVVQDEQRKRIALQLTTLTKTKRKSTLNMHKQRSKCIVMPEYTIEMGNHFVWEMSSGRTTLNVNPNVAKLNHYRVCEFGGDECVRKTLPLTDRRVHLWATKLISRVQQRLHSLCARWLFSESQMCQLVAASQ